MTSGGDIRDYGSSMATILTSDDDNRLFALGAHRKSPVPVDWSPWERSVARRAPWSTFRRASERDLRKTESRQETLHNPIENGPRSWPIRLAPRSGPRFSINLIGSIEKRISIREDWLRSWQIRLIPIGTYDQPNHCFYAFYRLKYSFLKIKMLFSQ